MHLVPPPLLPLKNKTKQQFIPSGVLEMLSPCPPAHPGVTSQDAESLGSR